MDIMEKVGDLVEMITGNDDLMGQFKKDPVAAVKRVLKDFDLKDIDLDEQTVEKLVTAVKAKISADQVGDLLGGLKKLF